MTEEDDDWSKVFNHPLLADVEPEKPFRFVKDVSERFSPDYVGGRQACKGFGKFKSLFKKVREDLQEGRRRYLDIPKTKEIKIAKTYFFFTQYGLAYVAETGKPTRKSGDWDYRLRVIYENGKEGDPLRSTFRRELRDDKIAQRITRNDFGPLYDPAYKDIQAENVSWIYVLRSLSDNPEVWEMQDKIIKIGSTKDLSKRFNRAEKDNTFLKADVCPVKYIKLTNLNCQKVEHYIQDFFKAGHAQADIAISEENGDIYHPKEWFFAKPEHVEQVVNLINEGTLNQYRFDVKKQEIAKIQGDQW